VRPCSKAITFPTDAKLFQLVAEPLAPMAQVRALVRKLVLENSSPVKCWKYGS
jgi:hypothetical protein